MRRAGARLEISDRAAAPGCQTEDLTSDVLLPGGARRLYLKLVAQGPRVFHTGC